MPSLRTIQHSSSDWAGFVCEEVVQPDGQTAFLLAKWHREFSRFQPAVVREVGVVCGGEEQHDEKVSGTPRSVL